MHVYAILPSRAGTTPGFWLDQLEEAHSRLLGAIDHLQQLAEGPAPDKELLVTVRWRVSEASLARRLLWGRIHDALARQCDPIVERDLRELQEADIRLIRASADHVARWPADAVIGDWEGYCRASEAMRRQMTDAVAVERRLLCPILEAIETRPKS